MSHREELNVFVGCAPGIEDLLERELGELGTEKRSAVPGGVEVCCDRPQLHAIALGCGLGLSLLLRVAHFRARHFTELEKRLRAIEWSRILPGEAVCELKVRTRRSRLYHTGGIASRASAVIEQSRGACEAEPGLPLGVLLRLENDECTVSLDLAGEAFHKRGYRQASGKAPLREDLARALLVLAGFGGEETALVDPLCGAGTLVIEGALLASRLAPGRARNFALIRLPDHDAADWTEQVERADASSGSGGAAIWGSDRDAGVVELARENSVRAGVSERVQIQQSPISRCPMPPAERGLIVANPPFGRRIGSVKALRNLYASLGNLRKKRGEGWRLALVAADPRLAQATGVRLERAVTTDHGGIKVGLYVEPRVSSAGKGNPIA